MCIKSSGWSYDDHGVVTCTCTSALHVPATDLP
jgi:hypothetical protein